MVASTGKSASRTASRERRRQQLIAATVKCISRRGMGGTTMAGVAKEAGLSQGIINLHFESKENLLTQTLQFLADEYAGLFQRAAEAPDLSPADKLLALMKLDLKPSVCDRRKLAVWFAFWGEAKAMPTYRKICARHDDRYDAVMRQLCDDIIRDGNYRDVSAARVTDALSSMTDGLWLSCLMKPESWDRHAALASVYGYLHAVFPKHYPGVTAGRDSDGIAGSGKTNKQ